MFLVVGLGNPGKAYAETRHNFGFWAIDAFFSTQMAEWREKFSGLTAKALVGTQDVVFLKPQTCMNLSGQSVHEASVFLRIAFTSVLVIHDELDLPFGQLRLKCGGGHGGHNGLRSIIGRLGTADFLRLRLGIGRPSSPFRGDMASYVLSRFEPHEKAQLPVFQTVVQQAIVEVIMKGAAKAMNLINTKKS